MAPSPLVWLVTGTSSGIGRDLVEAALQRGDKVIATARGRSFSKLQPLKDKGAATLELDVTAPIDVLKDVAKQAIEIYGHVDVLVNNAGYIACGALEELTPEETYNQFNTNVFGGLNVARAFLPYMRPRKTGAVIWIGSVGGWVPLPNFGMYIATKYALRGISETMNSELEPIGLRSLIFEFGHFRTKLLSDGNAAPYDPRIDDYNAVTATVDGIIRGVDGKQPGDPKKAVELIIDIVKDEGAVKGRKVPVTLQFGSDCFEAVKGTLQKTLNDMEEFKDIIVSTDFAKGS